MRQHVKYYCNWRRSIAAAALLATVAGVGLPVAQAETHVAQAGSAATSRGPRSGSESVSGIDALILHLHDSLKITQVQEPLWQRVATVMRDNAATVTQLAKTRAEGAANRTAVDDLESYAEISAAHAEGTKKMIPVFRELYNSMSDAQKKAADAEFREHHRGHAAR